jgi:hypothetical protein
MTTLVAVANVPAAAAVRAHPSRPSSRSGVAAGTSKPVATGVSPVGGCPASIVALIRSVWTRDADWAIRIAWRESRCQPGAHNGHSSAAGLFELLGHADMYRAVGCSPSQWAEASCNTRAAFLLYQGSGRGPWGG